MPDIYFPTSAVWIGNRFFPAGQPVPANDPAIKSHPACFESADRVADRINAPGFEQATAVPGEKRARRPRG